MKYILLTLPVIFAMSSLVIACKKGIEKTEKAECYKWQQEAKEYPDYFITEWQSEQCYYYSIEINAPIK